MKLLYKPVQLVHAKKVLLKDLKFDQVFEEAVVRENYPNQKGVDLYFVNKKNKYVWDESIQMFRKLRNIDESLNQADFFKMQGLSPQEVTERLRVMRNNNTIQNLYLFRSMGKMLSRSVFRQFSIL